MELNFSVNLFIEDGINVEMFHNIFAKDKSELTYILTEYQLYNVLPGTGEFLVTLNNNIYKIADIYYSAEKIFYILIYELNLSKSNKIV